MLENIDNMNFETALQKLETIVQKMETEELSLEQSLQYYEEGIKLVQRCRKLLSEAEFKIEKIANEGEAVNIQNVEDDNYLS